MQNNEIWKDIPGEDGYQVSNMGRVRYIKILRGFNTGGALSVKLDSRQFRIHKLVAKVFLGIHSRCVVHKDGNLKNNRVENLAAGRCSNDERVSQSYGGCDAGE